MAKAQLDPGMTIDGFTLGRRLYRGGMAAIWEVTHPDISAPIVLKAPFLDYDGDLSLIVGFEVEQMILSELKGPHVPRLLASGDVSVQPYVVMEHVPGPSLGERLAHAPMALDEVIARGAAIADALGDLHTQSVLHLDLKPANILFRETGEAVLLDFGLSRHVNLPDLLDEQYNRPTGTTEYMAPEQLAKIRSDKRSDIFALGGILYQMATGQMPFGEASSIKQVKTRVWRDPIPPRQLNPAIAPALQEVILKCLEPLPDQRYATAEELAFDLRNLDIVELTGRASKLERDDFKTTARRWLRARRTLEDIASSATQPPPRPPIILVAVDLHPGHDALRAALMDAAVSVLANMPGARLSCINVMHSVRLPGEDAVDQAGESVHVARMADLRAWASPLELPRGKITYHLVEARTFAAGVVTFAKQNRVDHLVVAAPSGSGQAASKVAMQITSQAPCTVTVVRIPESDRAAQRR